MKKGLMINYLFIVLFNIVSITAEAQTYEGKRLEFELTENASRAQVVKDFQKLAFYLANLGLLIGLLVVVKKLVTGDASGYKGILNWVIAALLTNLLIYIVPAMFFNNVINVNK